MRSIAAFVVVLLFATKTLAQKVQADSTPDKEGVAIAEFGGVYSKDIHGKSSFGYGVAVETTPIENWLELELGASSTYGVRLKETDIDFLFKKPWTFSPRLEFMFGLGAAWNHATDEGITANSWGGEAALDFMYWPFKKHQFGFYFEPGYEHNFKGSDQSVEMSGGLLVNIP